MSLEFFDIVGWVASSVGHIILLALLFRRRRYQDFSAFTALILFSVVRSLVLLIVYRSYNSSFFNAYWALAGVDEALGLAIVYQVASMVFRPAGAWARDVRTALWVTVAFSLAIAVLLTYFAAPATFAPVQSLIVKGKFFTATLMMELFVGVMALSARVGIPWRSHVMHICQGLGFYAAFCVILDTTITCYGIHSGSRLYQELSHLRIVGYLISLLYWIVMLFRKAPEGQRMPPSLRRQLGALQQQLDADLLRLRALK